MTSKMQVAVVKQFGEPLEFEKWDIPVPQGGGILVRTVPVCHTDVHAWRGDWPVKPVLPFIPGHDGIGLAVARVRT